MGQRLIFIFPRLLWIFYFARIEEEGGVIYDDY